MTQVWHNHAANLRINIWISKHYKRFLSLYAVVRQSFVKENEPTSLEKVKTYLRNDGFDIIRNNDYRNPELGIILEDLHDENVLTKDGVLFFIDTVFYLEDDFWND